MNTYRRKILVSVCDCGDFMYTFTCATAIHCVRRCTTETKLGMVNRYTYAGDTITSTRILSIGEWVIVQCTYDRYKVFVAFILHSTKFGRRVWYRCDDKIRMSFRRWHVDTIWNTEPAGSGNSRMNFRLKMKKKQIEFSNTVFGAEDNLLTHAAPV